jgi:hypothetical protein
MITKSLAILLAVLGLLVSAVQTSAQPRMGGGWRGGGFGGIRPRAAARPFAPRPFAQRPFVRRPFGPMGGGPYGGGYGGYPQGFAGEGGGYGPPPRAFGGDWRNQQNAVRQAVREGRQVPLGQAIEAVRRRAPGRELDAGLETGPNGRPVYRVRWAGQDGRRQDYLVDAGTGAVIGAQGGGQPPPWGGP